MNICTKYSAFVFRATYCKQRIISFLTLNFWLNVSCKLDLLSIKDQSPAQDKMGKMRSFMIKAFYVNKYDAIPLTKHNNYTIVKEVRGRFCVSRSQCQFKRQRLLICIMSSLFSLSVTSCFGIFILFILLCFIFQPCFEVKNDKNGNVKCLYTVTPI